MTLLEILSAVSGVEKQAIHGKIDFQASDATVHNLEVEQLLAAKLNSSHVPKRLLCNTHPVFMFTRTLDSVFKTIKASIGREKIFASFNLTPESQESVMSQFLDCCVRLISHDFDHKPWNCADEFDIFIGEKKNTSIRMASERFTRYNYVCAAVLHHDADICAFLRKFDHIPII